MKFKGKMDLWLWIILLLGEVLILSSFFDLESGWGFAIAIALFYNVLVLPFLIRNYVEVTDEKVTVYFGFGKESIDLSAITEVYRTRNPISSSAASLDRIVIKGYNKTLMCAVKEREKFFEVLREKNVKGVSEKKDSKQRKSEKISIIFSLVICAIIGFVLVTGNISVEYKEESFEIKATYWYDKEIDYAEVESIEFRDEKITGSRTGGFASMRLLLGDFNNKEFGNYTRYTYAKCDAGVILLVDDREIVLSGKDVESTREIYEELVSRCGF